MSWILDGRPLRRILVTRLRYLGDIAMSSVVLAVLKRGDPELELGYLCEANHAEILRDHPLLDHLHILASRRSGRDARARSADRSSGGYGTLSTIKALRRRRYDLAVDLFFNPRSAWLLRGGGITFRIGGARGWRSRLYTHQAPAAAAATGRFAQLAPGGLGDHLRRLAPLRLADQPFATWFTRTYGPGELRTRVAVPALAGSVAERELADLGIPPGQSFVALAPSATWPAKEWPPGHWRELIEQLAARIDLPLVMLTVPGREDEQRRLAAGLPPSACRLLHPLPLRAALRVVGAAALLICVDGGLMHGAVAMETPTLALFGPTSPEIWFPYASRPGCRVLCTRPPCHPCDLHTCEAFVCLPDLAPRVVATAALHLLAAGGVSDGAAPPTDVAGRGESRGGAV